jgi:DNA processing protein
VAPPRLSRGALRARRELAAGCVAVFPTGGLVHPRPLGNSVLLARAARVGVHVSESAARADTVADPARQAFLLAMAGAATVLVEPAPAGHGYAVVRSARADDRPLYAVPGPVTAPEHDFAHRLISDGVAELVTDAADVLHRLGAYSVPR